MADGEILYIVKADNKQAVDALNKVQQSFDGVTQKTKQLAGSTQSSNMLLQSTGRIVQDLPYGFMAVGNNITFMAEQMGYASAQGIKLKDQLKGMLSSLMGTGGLIFAISTAVTVITMLERSSGSAKGKMEGLTEQLKSHWSEAYKVRKEWEKFNEELRKFSVFDLAESFRAVNEQINAMGLNFFEAGLYALGFRGQIEAIATEMDKLRKERAAILGNFITTTYNPDETMKRVKELLKEEKAVIKEIENRMSSAQKSRAGGQGSSRASGTINITGGRGIGGRGGMAGAALVTEGFSEEVRYITNLSKSSADILRTEFMQAWQDIFGEANSLFEKFLANIVSSLADLAAQSISSNIFGFLGNLLFPGAGTAASAIMGKTVIINQMGDEEVSRVVVKGIDQAQRLRLL